MCSMNGTLHYGPNFGFEANHTCHFNEDFKKFHQVGISPILLMKNKGLKIHEEQPSSAWVLGVQVRIWTQASLICKLPKIFFIVSSWCLANYQARISSVLTGKTKVKRSWAQTLNHEQAHRGEQRKASGSGEASTKLLMETERFGEMVLIRGGLG